MGYVTKMTRLKMEQSIINQELYDEIFPHLVVIMIRKSSRKLQQFISCFKNKSEGIKVLIQLKYELSQCRAEVLDMISAMAKDPERFEIDDFSFNLLICDIVHGVRFNYYNFASSEDKVGSIKNPILYINGEKFVHGKELYMICRIFESLKLMKHSEYTLQKELKTLEEQNRVFKIYTNEKLNGKNHATR